LDFRAGGELYCLSPYPTLAQLFKAIDQAIQGVLLRYGSAARLLGIRASDEIRLPPLRGNLFECRVVSESFKWNVHYRQQLPLHFWRDHKGREIDLWIDLSTQVIAIEIKSGATINRDFFCGLDYYQSLAQNNLRQSFSDLRWRAATKPIGWHRSTLAPIATPTESLKRR
jgi:hypothetical protein